MKFTKKVVAGLLILVLAFSSVGAVGVKAEDHQRPDKKGYCNNTYRDYPHKEYRGSDFRETHITTAGKLCSIYELLFIHDIVCTSCGASFGTKTFYCTTAHTVCNIYIENH